MLKHQKQEPYECFPTVLGMVLDRPARSVVREILGRDLSKASWPYLISNTHTDTSKKLTLHIQQFLDKYTPWIPIEAYLFEEQRTVSFNVINLEGLGIMVTKDIDGGFGHIVAFENNLIFDPDPTLSAPMIWEQYRDRLRYSNREVSLIASKEE